MQPQLSNRAMNVCIRWVTKDLEIAEDFIALHPLEQTNAETIVSAIKDVLLRLALPLDQARGQCYDGCATMTGSKNGVATILKKSAPHRLLTHCYCHALNLAVGDTVKSVPVMKETLEDAYELTKLIKYSPKREAALKKKQELKIRNLDLPLDTGETNTKLKLLCPTRWTVRAKALHSIASNYQAIQDMLEWCEDSKNTSDSEIRARAGGVAKKMDRFHFLYGLHLSMLVLDHSDNLSATLQSPQLCAADAQETARLVVRTLRSLRTDEHAQQFYDKVTREAHRCDLAEPEPRLPRRRTRRPIRFDQGSEPYHPQSPDEFYRCQYFAAIDTVVSTIEDRFDQPDYQVYMNLEQTLIKGAVGQCCEEHIKALEDNYNTLDS